MSNMSCIFPKTIFPSVFWIGLQNALPLKDGYSVYLSWKYAIPSIQSNTIGYNIYFSTNINDVFTEGSKYFTQELFLTINRFVLGDVQYFAVRSMEYDPIILNYTALPIASQAENAYTYPETLLTSDIDSIQLNIPVIDASEFPSFGIIKLGIELMKYSSIDYANNIFQIDTDCRGYYNSVVTSHNADGYDGYKYQDPFIKYFAGFEDQNNIICEAEPKIEYPEYPYVESDGYKQVIKDLLTTDLAASDETNTGFPPYDYSGFHQTNIMDYFSGHCIGSYAGGEYGCSDGYKTRGLNLQLINSQRLEILLQVTGEPVILLRRKWAGIRCNCFRMNLENAEGRCKNCFSVGFVGGYDQYYYQKRKDGRILMRFEPTADDLTVKSHGLQQTFAPNCWTLVEPAIKDRDIIIRFNEDGTEEFRYEVMNVTRNRLLFSLSGSQKMQIYRVDKTDIIYQWRAIRSTVDNPVKLNTTMGELRGYGPHFHVVTITDGIINLSQINSTTSTMASHNHPIINGIVQEVLGHSHEITF